MTVPGFVKGVAVALAIGIAATIPAKASEQVDGGAFQTIIKNQMSAFAVDDARRAFSFATDNLKKQFQTPEFFMQMVRQGYQPVYRPQNVTFGQSKMTRFGPAQEVYVTGPKGHNWLALYSFEQQPDGSWRISGCYLTKAGGLST